MKRRLCFVWLPAAILAIVLPSRAGHPPRVTKSPAGRYSVRPAEFSSPPKIDGVLENPFWEKGTVIEDFTQFEPLEGGTPSEKTRAYLAYDKDNLYLAFRCDDSDPEAVRACLTPRDKPEQDDGITVYLDTFNDKKRAFVFQVNPCGIQVDGVYTESTRRHRGGRGSGGFERFDRNWDTYFLADARMDEKGYTIEMAIPFKSLRFPNAEAQIWGIKIQRSIRRKNEEIYWPPHTRDVNGFLVQSGSLEFHGAVAKGKNIEIMPVATGMQQSGQKFDPQAGLNFKWGVTSDMTFDSTLNPDFSQIEADMPQNDVNQRYALYYPEKRPFFLEGKDYFDTPFELIYSRTIVDPQWGFKLSGKTRGLTIGVLSAMDVNSPEIRLDEPEEEEEEDDVDEGPFYRGLVNIFRLKKDLFSESSIGIIATDKEQGISSGSLTDKFNRVAGVDGHFKFLRYNRFSFQVVGSVTKTAEEKTGFVPAYTLNLSHVSRHLQLTADYSSVPPDFEASLGYFRRKDIRYLRSRASYSFLPQNDLIVSIRPSLEYRRNYDFTGTLTDDEYSLSCFITGWRQSYLWASFTSGLERYNDIDFYQKDLMIGLGTEPLAWLSGDIRYRFGDGIYYDENPYLGYKKGLEMEIILKPFPNLGLLYSYENDRFYMDKGGESVYNINIISQRINYQLTRPLSVRLITDYNDYYKELYVSLLLGYQHNTGTVFYLGVDDNRARDESGVFRSAGRYYFIKFSYWWRL
jgi:hypothetical protein